MACAELGKFQVPLQDEFSAMHHNGSPGRIWLLALRYGTRVDCGVSLPGISIRDLNDDKVS